ncbi:MAG: ATP-binding protein [Candidatus Promineifilaceae bacterium]
MPALEISLFGPIQVASGGQPANAFESDKVRALLAYLAVESDQPHRRETLAAMLWPEKPETAARTNLRHALANLRHVIGDQDAVPPYLLITRQTIQFNTQSDYTLDVTHFAASQQRNQPAKQLSIKQLEENISVYKDDFLAGFSIADSIAFEEWMLVKREQYRRRMSDSLSRLANAYEQRGDYGQAIIFTRKRVDLQPWDETAHRQLIRLLALNGRRGAALEQYHKCHEILGAELGVEPTTVTTALYERIRDESWPDEIAKVTLPLFVTQEAAVTSTPLFVAREQELGRLTGFLGQALSGKGQIAFITGEAGSGKTALMHAFARQVMAEHADLLVASGKCSAYTGSGDPYEPFLEITSLLTGDVESGWEAGDISSEHARRLWSVTPQVAETLVENYRLLLDRFVSSDSLLARAQISTRGQLPDSIPWLLRLVDWVQANEMEPALSQSDLFDQFARLLGTLARRYPLVLLFDDLQWIDQGSLGLLYHLGQNLRGRRILILGAYRPEEVVRGADGEAHPLAGVVNELRQNFGDNQVDLQESEGRHFIDALLNSEPNRLDENFRRRLFLQTGGQALFTVEFLRGLQERSELVKDEEGRWSASEQLDWDTLPARVEAAIASRIGRLPVKCHNALTIASVEGETFTAEVVATIQGIGRQETLRCLSGDLSRQHHLVTAQSRRRLGQQTLSRYRFHHFLIQQYLYHDLDPVERAGLHETVGDTLVSLYGEREADLQELSGRLAWHYQEAGAPEKAIAYCQKAGDRAWKMSAAAEAITYYEQGLALLQDLPLSPERQQQELTLVMGLAVPLHATKGFAAPEVQATYKRAYLLSQQVGDTPQLFFTQSMLGSYYMTSGQYHTSLEIGRRIFELGQRFQNDLQMALARLIMAANYSQLGDFARCREQLEKMLAFYDYRQHHVLSTQFGIDPGVNALVWEALVLWIQGYPEQAEKQSREAIDLAQVLDHPFSLATALEVGAGIMHVLAGKYQAARTNLKTSIGLADEQKFGLFQVEGRFYEGFLQVIDGRTQEGIAQMEQSLAAWRGTGMRILYTVMLGLLAEAQGQAGQVDEGLQTLDEAFAEVESRDERFCESELLRVKGDLLRLRGEESAVIESTYQQAIKVARQQEAKSWELRATISLAKLWREKGKIPQARSMLSDVYYWFSEGFDTADLQEAKALLKELKNDPEKDMNSAV